MRVRQRRVRRGILGQHRKRRGSSSNRQRRKARAYERASAAGDEVGGAESGGRALAAEGLLLPQPIAKKGREGVNELQTVSFGVRVRRQN